MPVGIAKSPAHLFENAGYALLQINETEVLDCFVLNRETELSLSPRYFLTLRRLPTF